MYKVMIIDDVEIVRWGIRDLLDRKKRDLRFVRTVGMAGMVLPR